MNPSTKSFLHARRRGCRPNHPSGWKRLTAPARHKRLSQKAARATAGSARLVKAADHRDTHRWNLVTEDGTVLGHVEPSYGGTGRTGRNGWNHRLVGSFTAGGGPVRTREEAALQCALAWIRVATARYGVLSPSTEPRPPTHDRRPSWASSRMRTTLADAGMPTPPDAQPDKASRNP
ncbi:hypothetical protein [Streptomyces sp. JHA26]|uniref:hypothetical protein n=1 Tax=Streptomyces sp. JHA26 TaxID=1917143 RepID=UPI00117D3476|nr:hypothetical protein [Streptomyces sp. JHA26]